jgi:hypothetical protein
MSEFPGVDDGGTTELRIHGVSGTPIAMMLQHPHPYQVAGDKQAGFYRRDPDHKVVGTQDTPTQRAEGYSWGGLTSGSSIRALWLVLLPFMLLNVAAWAHPPRKAAKDPLVGAMSGLLRVIGLVTTLTLVLAVAEVSIDLIGWQCGGDQTCSSTHFFTRFLADGTGSRDGVRIALGVVLPVLLVGGLWWLARDTNVQYEQHAPPPPGGSTTAAPLGVTDLSKPSFWAGGTPVARLRALHVGAAFAALAAVVAYAARRGDSGRWNDLGAVIEVVAITVVALVAVALVLPTTGRRRTLLEGMEPPFASWLMASRWIGMVLLATAVVYGVMRDRQTATPAELPGMSATIDVILLAQLGLQGLLAAANLCTVIGRRTEMRAAGRRRIAFGFGPTLLAIAAIGVVNAYASGLVIRVADYLGTVGCRKNCAQAKAIEKLPGSYFWQARSFTIAAAAAGSLALVIVVIYRRRRRSERSRVRTSYTMPDESTSEKRAANEARVRQIASARALASMTDVALTVLPVVVFASVIASFVLWARWTHSNARWLSTLATPGTWLAGMLFVGLFAVGRASVRNESLRRKVGILWDLGTFWPRAAHPFAPPCYCERVVPEVAKRVETLIEQGDGVVLSCHSQGTVIGAAVVLQLDDVRAIGFLTYGCPLTRLYGRMFPHFFGAPELDCIFTMLDRRWINLYRLTDPIGGPVLVTASAATPVDKPPLVDPRFVPEPGQLCKPPIHGHSDYFVDAAYVTAVAGLATKVSAAKGNSA